MYAISLTSIPPRFDRLGPVLTRLLNQRPAPARVFLALPRQYRRFPGPVIPPEVPDGVELLWAEVDFGPATKAIPAARRLAGTDHRLIYCDDDWLMSPDWAASLLTEAPGATTGQAWSVERIGRVGNGADIAQGFSGVSVRPDWLAQADVSPPDLAWAVDDIWLSGHLACQGIRILDVPAARSGLSLAYSDAHGLQDSPVQDQSRDSANRACAALLHQRYGIWPPKG